ncbi:MAG: histidine phosphatase family protein [Lachnospiraceae bacterium]
MRDIYLIRHGMPDFPGGARMCLGRTDLPLGLRGRLQAALLGAEFAGSGLGDRRCSRLTRSRETAELMGCERPVVIPGLEEMDAGEWDGLSFDEIRRRWPEYYERRGRERALPRRGLVEFGPASRRFSAAVARAASLARGTPNHRRHLLGHPDPCCVRWRGAMLLRAGFQPPYGSATRLRCPEPGRFELVEYGRLPAPPMTPELAERLLAAAQLPEETAEHCRAAARAAMDIVCALAAAGLCLDETRIWRRGAAADDVSKGTPGHGTTLAGAGLMSQLGYPELAPLIAQHNDLEEPSRTDEAAVVFLADKLRRGAAPVRVTERFRESLSRCRDEEARRAHGRRLEAALESARRINDICGKDVVQI